MSWMNGHMVSTGSRDGYIKTFDTRTKGFVSELKRHTQEVCGLRWDNNESYLASGGNENHVYVWDIRKNNPVQCYKEHTAAVRALCWSPHNFGTLVTGGGNYDKTIKFWNVNSNDSVHTINTDSQVCNLAFSKQSNELVSAHGYSKNQLMVWNADRKERISVLDGHLTRVLHIALSPDGETAATAASDETLKFWTLFPKVKEPVEEGPSCFSSYLTDLR